MTKRADRGLGCWLWGHRYALILGIQMDRAWREARALSIKGVSGILPRKCRVSVFGLESSVFQCGDKRPLWAQSIVISRLILGVERGLEEAE